MTIVRPVVQTYDSELERKADKLASGVGRGFSPLDPKGMKDLEMKNLFDDVYSEIEFHSDTYAERMKEHVRKGRTEEIKNFAKAFTQNLEELGFKYSLKNQLREAYEDGLEQKNHLLEFHLGKDKTEQEKNQYENEDNLENLLWAGTGELIEDEVSGE